MCTSLRSTAASVGHQQSSSPGPNVSPMRSGDRAEEASVGGDFVTANFVECYLLRAWVKRGSESCEEQLSCPALV
jgi:hypothetical protein